mmetsp:Transcript_33660/g.103300  ORF Transcript_33660/g.103300 Transcript_33660/m.103300 type:complete len:136 (-) Transcript_33660:21-428(-)
MTYDVIQFAQIYTNSPSLALRLRDNYYWKSPRRFRRSDDTIAHPFFDRCLQDLKFRDISAYGTPVRALTPIMNDTPVPSPGKLTFLSSAHRRALFRIRSNNISILFMNSAPANRSCVGAQIAPLSTACFQTLDFS